MITDEKGQATYNGALGPENSYYIELTAKTVKAGNKTGSVPGSARANPMTTINTTT